MSDDDTQARLSIKLKNGKDIKPQFVGWEVRESGIGPNGADNNTPYLETLKTYGMPRDLPCFFLTINCAAIGKPDYAFQIIGVCVDPPFTKPQAATAHPFMLLTPDGTEYLIGYIWQMVVLTTTEKSENRSSSFCAETYIWHVIGMMSYQEKQILTMFVPPDVPQDKRIAEIRKLTNGYDLMRRFWAGATVSTKSGRPRKATAAPETIPTWSKQYDEAMAALNAELAARTPKQLARYAEPRRTQIIQRAFVGIEKGMAEALAKYTNVADVALRYTAWRCSGIKIGAWKTTQYRQVLRRSDKANAIKRGGNEIKLSGG